MRAFAALLVLVGCAPADRAALADTAPAPTSSSETTTSAGSSTQWPATTDPGTIPTTLPATPSHAEHLQPLWNARCGTCHLKGNDAGTLNLDADAWGKLVDVPSFDVGGMDLVEPGDPDASFLWHKLMGTHRDVAGGTGARMPLGDALDAFELDLVEAWILAGAAP